MKLKHLAVAISTVALSSLQVAQANLLNGNFEDGLAGWTVINNGGSNPVTLATGVTAASAGQLNSSLTNDQYIYSSQSSPGNSIIAQTFKVGSGTNKVFFDVSYINGAPNFHTPDSLSYSGAPNQQARFDILVAGADLESWNPADLIATAYVTQVGAPGNLDWNTVEVDVTAALAAHEGQDVIFRFAQIDNQNVFNLALDNINIGLTQTPTSIFFAPVSKIQHLGAANVLDSANGDSSTSAKLQGIIDQLAGLGETERRVALQKVSPETSVALNNSSMQTTSGALDTIQIRLNSLRTAPLTSGQTAQNSVSSQGLSSGDVPTTENIWIKAFGGQAERDRDGEFAGFDSDIYGLAFGSDTQLDNGLVLGLAYTYADTNVVMDDFRDGDGSDIATHQLTFYSSYDLSYGYLEGMISYAHQRYETKRDTGSPDGVVDADFSGDQLALRVTAGFPLQLLNQVTLTPKIGVEWVSFEHESYTEKGSAIALNVKGNSVERFRANIGASLSTAITHELGLIKPAVSVNIRHEFDDDALDSTASFVGGGSTFTTEGQEINNNTYGLGLSLTLERDNGSNLGFILESEAASGYRSYSAQILASWMF